MADDKKIIFSMVGVSKIYPPQKQVLNYLQSKQYTDYQSQNYNPNNNQ